MFCHGDELQQGYPLVIQHSYSKWPFIVDFPIGIVIFHILNYQRINLKHDRNMSNFILWIFDIKNGQRHGESTGSKLRMVELRWRNLTELPVGKTTVADSIGP